jgi:hypothetical protein
MLKKLVLTVIFFSMCIGGVTAEDAKKKIVFLSGKASHGRMQHEHRAGNMLMADRLSKAGLNLDIVVV